MKNKDLVEKYHPYLYNLALRLVYYKEDAEDLTQEVWIKILNSIDTFEKKSDFKTWSYRIMMNHFLNEQRKDNKLTFENFENTMNNMKDEYLCNTYEEPQKQLLLNEAKTGCMLGMLLCLEKEQRAIFVLGEIFAIQSHIACEVFNITKENFRKKLSRARHDLYTFMNNHCGVVNIHNPCKCNKKTKSLIEQHYINPKNLLFDNTKQKTLKHTLQIKANLLDKTLENSYENLYQEHVFCDSNEKVFAKNILQNKEIIEIFDF